MPARLGTFLVALLLLPAAAQAAELPTVHRTITASGTCGSASYRAPMAGYLTTRLHGRGDWDLAMGDQVSQGFRGSEVVQNWVTAGERLTAVACRHDGATGRPRVTFTLEDATPEVQRGATRVARVRIADQGQVARLERLGFDATHRQSAHRADVLVAGDRELARLRSTGLPFRIVTRDLYARDTRTLRADARAAGADSALPSGRTTYREYADYGTELKQLVDANPGLVRPVTIGKSFQGRDITGVEIARDVDGDDGRPVYFVMGVHHAREWPAGEAAMELAYKLTKDQADPRIAKLLSSERVVIVPLVNPDGFVVSRGSYSPSDQVVSAGDPTGVGQDYGQLVEAIAPPGGFGAYRRKNCNGGDPNQPCETKYGVDNNRNYGNLWGGPGGSPDITSQSYHGPAPRSEPETQAVFNFVRTHHVTTLITLHTVAGLVLRPPGLAQLGLAPDENRMKALGDAMASAAGYTSQFSWQLYDTAGTTEDDTYAATGGYGYTYELGTTNGPFHGAYADSVIKEWTGDNEHAKQRGGVQEALLLGAEAAATTADHAVLQGSAPPGRILHLTKSFKTTTSEYCASGIQPVLNIQAAPSKICPGGVQKPVTLDDSLDSKTTVPASGRFEWHIGQSTRPFVNGGAVFEKVGTPATVTTIDGGPGGGPQSSEDKSFDLPDKADRLTITLHAQAPADDYDIEVFKDGKSLGTSGNAPGNDEELPIMDAAPGTYVVRVSNYAAAGPYTITVAKASVERTVTTGTKESYTLTCEDTAGKVYRSIALTIDRGQVVTANPCDADTPSQIGPPAGTPSRAVKIRFTGLRLRPKGAKRRIRFRISCPKGAPAVCRGRFRLVTKLNGRTRRVAGRRFAVKPGRKKVVNPIVRKRVYRALKRGKRIRLRVRLTGSAGDLGLEVVTKRFERLKRPR